MTRSNGFLKLPKGKLARMDKQRLISCPYHDCHPISYAIGESGTGPCVGLISKVDHLDCIRMCVFPYNSKRVLESFMTPDDAAALITCLSCAIRLTYEYNPYYKSELKYLTKVSRQRTKRHGKANPTK